MTAFDPIPDFIGDPDRQRIVSEQMSRAEEAFRARRARCCWLVENISKFVPPLYIQIYRR